LADYFTKHHPATHHKTVHPTILTAVNDPAYRKLFVTASKNVKSGGKDKEQTTKTYVTPTKTSVATKSFVKTLFLTPKFQKTITAKGA
jgi:hypothetical protein